MIITQQQQFEIDFFQGKFNENRTYSSSYGYNTIKNMEDAILFNLIYENVHLGNKISMKKSV